MWWDGMCMQTQCADMLHVYADADGGLACGWAMQWDGMCMWTQCADVLHVYADVDGGRGRVAAQTCCMCVRTWMSIKKGHKRNTYLGIWVMGAWMCWRVDVDDCRERKKGKLTL